MRPTSFRMTVRNGFAGLALALAVCSDSAAAPAEQLRPLNQVLEWNQIFIDTLVATNTANSSSQRLGAIVHTAIFDAYNGVDRRTRRYSCTTAPRTTPRAEVRSSLQRTSRSLASSHLGSRCWIRATPRRSMPCVSVAAATAI